MKVMFVISFLLCSFAFAQVRPTGVMVGGGGIQMEALNGYIKKEYELLTQVASHSKRCSSNEIVAKDIFELAKKFQALIFVDGTKAVGRDPLECAWTESNAPVIACMMDDTLSMKLAEVTENKDFDKLAAHQFKISHPKASNEQVKSEVEAVRKFLRSLNPKTSKPAKVN